MLEVPLVEFADKMNEIMPEIMQGFARYHRHDSNKENVTLSQLLILNILHINGESKMKDLAAGMNVSTAAMTGIIQRLVKAGYCRRVYDADDRRIIRVRLSEKGTSALKKLNLERRQAILKIFGKLSEKDRFDYLRILMQIREVLSGENNS